MARLAVARLMPPAEGAASFPWGTFTANLLACILLGIGLSLAGRQQLSPAQQLLLITGFCGGFSTFSTFSADALYLIQQGQSLIALAYVLSSVFLGVASIFSVLYFTAVTSS